MKLLQQHRHKGQRATEYTQYAVSRTRTMIIHSVCRYGSAITQSYTLSQRLHTRLEGLGLGFSSSSALSIEQILQIKNMNRVKINSGYKYINSKRNSQQTVIL